VDKTHFWQPGSRCVVARSADRTVVHIQVDDETETQWELSLLCVNLDERGFAAGAPSTVWQGDVSLLGIPSEGVAEGRATLPPISNSVWPRCYLRLQPNRAAVDRHCSLDPDG